MVKAYSDFLKSYFVFCMALSVPVFLVSFCVVNPLFSHTIPIQFLFFVLVTGILHYFFIKNLEKKPQQFVTAFLGLTGLKLFLYLMVIVVYFLTNKKDAVAFILSFLFFYLVFTAFEIYSLLRSSNARGNTLQ